MRAGALSLRPLRGPPDWVHVVTHSTQARKCWPTSLLTVMRSVVTGRQTDTASAAAWDGGCMLLPATNKQLVKQQTTASVQL